jgi:hypothetical protein
MLCNRNLNLFLLFQNPFCCVVASHADICTVSSPTYHFQTLRPIDNSYNIISNNFLFVETTIQKRSIGPAEVAAWNMLGYIWDLFEALTGKSILCRLQKET